MSNILPETDGGLLTARPTDTLALDAKASLMGEMAWSLHSSH